MAADNRLDPIVAAIQRRDLQRAETLCRDGLRTTPDEPDVLLLLGLTLQQQGRVTDAVDPYRRLTELFPKDSMHWANYATALTMAQNLTDAERAAETALRLAPESPERMEQLGLLKLLVNKPADARDTLLHAHDLAPESASIAIHAARACAICRDARADLLVHGWRAWKSLDDALKAELSEVLVQISEPWDAMELLEELVRRAPTDWPTQLSLARVYERVNRPEEASAKLDWVTAARGTTCSSDLRDEIAVQRAQLAIRQRSFGEALALLKGVSPHFATGDGYYFALAKAYDGAGDAAATMAALATAHRLQMEGLATTNPELLLPDEPLLPHVTERVSASDYRAWPSLKAPGTTESPVFVVGFPRSGTTLLEQMLDAHPSLQSMDERPFFNELARQLEDAQVMVPRDLSGLDQHDCDELRKGYILMACGKVARNWDTRLIDKNPLNMLWLPMIHRLFPRAQFIFVMRHPCDVVLSCYLQNFRAGPLVSACRSLEQLSRTYVAAMENWIHHVQVFQPDVMTSRYEDLVADLAAHTRRIAGFLGLSDAGAMAHFDVHARAKGFIRTPSYTQVIEPVSGRAVNHWLRYRTWFEPVLPILQPMIERWSYTG